MIPKNAKFSNFPIKARYKWNKTVGWIALAVWRNIIKYQREKMKAWFDLSCSLALTFFPPQQSIVAGRGRVDSLAFFWPPLGPPPPPAHPTLEISTLPACSPRMKLVWKHFWWAFTPITPIRPFRVVWATILQFSPSVSQTNFRGKKDNFPILNYNWFFQIWIPKISL